jgi:hypothetical protein
MKIAWFTPFHKMSAIGHDSKSVCETIGKSNLVDIFTSDQEDCLQTNLKVFKYQATSFKINDLDKYDYVVYNMGNNARNHKDIWEIMQRNPGVLLLHDQMMQNFFSQINLNPDYGGDPTIGL